MVTFLPLDLNLAVMILEETGCHSMSALSGCRGHHDGNSFCVVTDSLRQCTKTVPEVVLKCNDSRRCLDVSLMCDFLLSQNCKTAAYPQDKTDQSRDYPSYCFRKDTTTTEGPTTTEAPSAPFNWRPIVAIIGAAVALLLLGWCCWRPGYLPWRLSRLRNVPFLNTQRFVCCRGPTACCPCLKCCAAQGTEDPSYIDSFVSTRPGRKSTLNMNPFTNGSKVDAVPYRRLQNPGGPSRKYSVRGSTGYAASLSPSSYYGNDPNNFASDWLKFISSDGGHLREQR
ncbi:hypothetical protein DPMN_174506 [Dreissena polymorpha]|uniref:Uncharacterized protein n=1 Tax=Dreissena polymorpha TaxID=45954 RepID=A0A9D4IF70_DREPO|nr:hypothetical protein DPMN_174506 [Dreissena polymorpha]